MKRIAFSIALMVVLVSCATQPAQNTGTVYQEIIEQPGIPAGDLYETSHRWIAETFKSSKAVIEYENKDEGQIIGNGVVDVNYSLMPVPTEFTLILEVKDGKVRASFKNLRIANYAQQVKFSASQINKFSAKAATIVADLRTYLTKPSDNW